MITKRTGNGQTECTRCKEKGKFALTWDSFLYTFNDKPYCFNCLMEMLEEKNNAIDKAIEELDKYINRCTNEGGYDYDVCLMVLNCMKKAKSILRGEDNGVV